MLDNFSFDHASEKIFDSRTRAYFEEVKSSYVVGNYRSATVMLWSVVVCDLLFKLQHLAEIYTDTTAQKILREIDDLQLANPASPIWEGALVDKIVERTALIDLADRAGLSHIQSQRHLSAHPVIRNGVELHRPNKDDVRAMMRNALESVLTKFPLVSRRVMEQMLADLADTQQLLPDELSLKKYLESKYFSRFHIGVAAAVFRSLWKLVFRTENESCDANRSINSVSYTHLTLPTKA